MIIVAGSLTVEPEERAAYLTGCETVVDQARRAPGCLDFALSPDLLDPARINVYERWTDEPALHAFRGSGPSSDQQAALLAVDVAEYDVRTRT